MNYRDVFYTVSDGLKLYARDYAAANRDAEVLLCMHGLSRNSADFEPLIGALGNRYRMLVVDQRGRGKSQWDDVPERYQILNYVNDMWQLLDQLDVERVTLIGTSMGGLMGMVMAAQQPHRVQGLVINDVGPEVAPEGLARIMSYVGKASAIENWDDAVAYTRDINAVCFPSFSDAQWLAMAQRLYQENELGVPVAAYDPRISSPIRSDESAAVPTDLWPMFAELSVPMLAIRGALSDLMSAECLSRMQREQPDLLAVEVDGVGHAPVLDEPQAVDAIQRFLRQQ